MQFSSFLPPISSSSSVCFFLSFFLSRFFVSVTHTHTRTHTHSLSLSLSLSLFLSVCFCLFFSFLLLLVLASLSLSSIGRFFCLSASFLLLPLSGSDGAMVSGGFMTVVYVATLTVFVLVIPRCKPSSICILSRSILVCFEYIYFFFFTLSFSLSLLFFLSSFHSICQLNV